MKLYGETNMKGKMKAAVLHKPLNLRIEDVNIPQIRLNEVLVKMNRVGICGSDIHYYSEGAVASYIVKEPLILGHECAGEIVEVSNEVENLRIGQRVVIEPGFTCGKCEYCRKGMYNLCEEVKFYGTPPYDGAFAEYVSAPEQNVYVIPDEMSYEEGAMIEPLAVGMMAAKMGKVTVQDVVAVLGAGPIGQMALQATKVYGAFETFVTDVIGYRLDFARKYGAKAVVNAADENVVERMLELTKGKGVDVVIDASGSPSAILQALDITKPGGRIVLVGYPTTDVPVPVAKIISKELEMTGIHRYANVFPAAIKAVSSGKVVVKPYVTHIFPFEQLETGFKIQINKTGNPMKIQIAM
jgi:L-iditol 2-dehydrogenase